MEHDFLSENQLYDLNKVCLTGDMFKIQAYLNNFSSFQIINSFVEAITKSSIESPVEDLINYQNLLLSNKLNINNPTSYGGDTPLYRATLQNNINIVKDLIERGVDVNQQCLNGSYPLTAISYHSDHLPLSEYLLEYLLNMGANPNLAKNTGESAFIDCVQGGSPQSIIKMIEAGADINFEVEKSFKSQKTIKTPLIYVMQQFKKDNIIALCQSAQNQEQIDKFKTQAETMINHSSYDFVINILNTLEIKINLESSLPISQHQKSKSLKV